MENTEISQTESSPGGSGNSPPTEREERMVFTTWVEEAVLNFFLEHPEFYDRTRHGFRDFGKKGSLLSQVGKELNVEWEYYFPWHGYHWSNRWIFKIKSLSFNISAPDIMEWFFSCKTTFGRLMKREGPSGSSATQLMARQLWIFTSFSFLGEHIRSKCESVMLRWVYVTSILGLIAGLIHFFFSRYGINKQVAIQSFDQMNLQWRRLHWYQWLRKLSLDQQTPQSPNHLGPLFGSQVGWFFF